MAVNGRPKKPRGRPPVGYRRPVITLRVHEDLYEAITLSAKQRRLTISEETERRLGITAELERMLKPWP